MKFVITLIGTIYTPKSEGERKKTRSYVSMLKNPDKIDLRNWRFTGPMVHYVLIGKTAHRRITVRTLAPANTTHLRWTLREMQ
jgi:hypothetical protein